MPMPFVPAVSKMAEELLFRWCIYLRIVLRLFFGIAIRLCPFSRGVCSTKTHFVLAVVLGKIS